MTPQSRPGTDEVRRALDDVFSRREFGEEPPSVLEEVLEWLVETLAISPDPGAVGTVAEVLAGALVLVLAGLLVWLVVRLVRQARGRAGADELADLAELRRARVKELFQSALAARRSGDSRLAVRLALFALVAGLGERGAVEFRDSWTYREVLRNGRPDPETSALLAELVVDLEAKEFGSVPIAEADLDRLEALCREHLELGREAVA